MTKSDLPKGYYDVLPDPYFNKLAVEERLLKLFGSYGYDRLETSPIDFYGNIIETVSGGENKDVCKLIDCDGDVLAVRGDYNLSVSRIAAEKLVGYPMPIRLCYAGNEYTMRNSTDRAIPVAGTALFGEGGVEGDAETLALAIESVLQSGIKDFSVCLGHRGVIEGILNEAKASETVKAELLKEGNLKGLFAVGKLDEGITRVLNSVIGLYGGIRVLEQASDILIDNKAALVGLVNLYQTQQLLEEYGLSQYITYDLGITNDCSYYTGMVFRIVSKFGGVPVITGGRFDKLSEKFGVSMPAVGYKVKINSLIDASERSGIPKLLPVTGVAIGIEDRCSCLSVAKKTAQSLIEQGYRVTLKYKSSPDDIRAYAKAKGITLCFFVNRYNKVEEVAL